MFLIQSGYTLQLPIYFQCIKQGFLETDTLFLLNQILVSANNLYGHFQAQTANFCLILALLKFFSKTVVFFYFQYCDYCDPARPDKMHPPEFAADGMETWWQSPPLSRGMKYNEVNLTIDLGQVSIFLKPIQNKLSDFTTSGTICYFQHFSARGINALQVKHQFINS